MDEDTEIEAVDEQIETLDVEEQEDEIDEASGADEDVTVDGAEGEQPEELSISIEGDTPPEEETKEAAPWVRELRKNQRELTKKLAERDTEIARLKESTKPAEVVVGEMPTMEACNWDEDDFRSKTAAWIKRKDAVEQRQAKIVEDERKANEDWQRRLNAYNTAKTELKFDGFEDAETVVLAALSKTQQGILLHAADRAELMVAALGRAPKTLKTLSEISNPIEFTKALVKLEIEKLKVTPRKTAPLPEKRVSGTAPSSIKDSTLAKLRAEAERTNDYSKVTAHKARLKAASA